MYWQSGKKLVKQPYLLHMCLQYGELRPTSGWDWLVSLGHPSKFQWFSRRGFITAPTSLNGGRSNFARVLAVCWAGTLYIHFRRHLPLSGILLRAVFTLHPSLAFSYIGRVTAWHVSSRHQPNCCVQQRAPSVFGRAAITLGISPHSSLCMDYCNAPMFVLYGAS